MELTEARAKRDRYGRLVDAELIYKVVDENAFWKVSEDQYGRIWAARKLGLFQKEEPKSEVIRNFF